MRKPTISPRRTSPTESRKQPPSERSVTRALWASVELSHIASRLTRSRGFARRSSIFRFFDVKRVKHSMHDGRQENSHHANKNHAAEKRISRGKKFRAVCLKRIDWSHATEDHRRFEN